jgi:hypothetical protein
MKDQTVCVKSRQPAGDFAILIGEFFIHDLMLRDRRMLQEKLKFGAQPTFDRNGLGNPSAIAQNFVWRESRDN